MMLRPISRIAIALGLVAPLALAAPARAARPTVEQALKLVPVQGDVEYDRPAPAEAAGCKIEPITAGGLSGWQVFDANGRLLRRFVDTNNDKKIDQWCYYQNGIEVYRDIDANFNEKADQYRWLGTAGSRWGLDTDENRTIDRWKMISPEEVTGEVVAALRDRDASRFRRVLLTKSELKSLGLGAQRQREIEEQITAAAKDFASHVTKRSLVQEQSKWIHFGATRPGIVPAGTDGSTRDLLLYDNVAAIIETEGKHGQVIVGTLVQVDAGWRVIDLPTGEATAGYFTSTIGRPQDGQAADATIDRKMEELLGQLEKIDKQLTAATTPAALAELNGQRADVLQQMVTRAETRQERDSWIRQFADTVSAAAQSGDYPQGVARLQAMRDQLDADSDDLDVIAYVQFRHLMADYSQQLRGADSDFAKVQEAWLKQLDAFVAKYPTAPHAAEAMLQLALAKEFAGRDDEAGLWYGRITKDFPDSALAVKAAGAQRRLNAVGQTMSLRGKTPQGQTIDVNRYRGRVVLVHYWASWFESSKRELEIIKALKETFPADQFAAVGVNLDHDKQQLVDFLRTNPVSWPQLYEPGGMDSRLANEWGIQTLPAIVLIDKAGRVVRRNIEASQLEAEIRRLTK